MAVSGIDHTIKIFSPDANAQRNARKGVGVHSADRGMSTLGFGRRRRPRRPSAHSPPAVPRDPLLGDDDDDDDDDEVTENGLKSRKAMHEQYQITSQNDMDRKGGESMPKVEFLSMLADRGMYRSRGRVHNQSTASSISATPAWPTANRSWCRRRGR